MIYAYIQNGVVLEVERRTQSGYQIHDLYHGSLVPFFIPVPEELAPHIRKGWAYSHAEGFHEPKPFEINPETGDMYLPAGIPAETFWHTMQENIRLQNEVGKLAGVVDTMLVESLTQKGVLLND